MANRTPPTAAPELAPPLTVDGRRRLLSGWGRTSPSAAHVHRPGSAAEVERALREAPARGVIARGLGRSYGDLAQNAGGLVLDMTGLARVLDFDAQNGVVTAEAGCPLAALLELGRPHGWFLPVTPGTRHVTVGGAIACDVHGKNHHRDGSFGHHLVSLTLLTTAGDTLRLDPVGTGEEFWATVGGLGLTGVIVDATIRLLRVEANVMRVDVERARDLDDALARLTATDHRYRYSAAWVDCLAPGARLGRALLLQGDHAAAGDLPVRTPSRPLRRPAMQVPPRASLGALLRGGLVPAAFNELYFRANRERKGRLQSAESFFYPLDALSHWNRLYGRSGFLQYQFVVPSGAEDVLHRVIGRLHSSSHRAVLAVLKRFGPAAGPLSFPIPGWTLALDIPVAAPGLGRLLDESDELVAAAGGRVYLAKDARLRGERLAAMYPQLDAWREVRARLDPGGRMQCDLARRLSVT